jgi:Glycosyltransferase family 29 (sialyltransferase)
MLFLDDHDVVVRFNNAPVLDYENDVGNKTTIRILNSQILSKPHFQFVNSSLYENISLAVWDPIGYNLSLEEVESFKNY